MVLGTRACELQPGINRNIKKKKKENLRNNKGVRLFNCFIKEKHLQVVQREIHMQSIFMLSVLSYSPLLQKNREGTKINMCTETLWEVKDGHAHLQVYQIM